MDQEKIGKFICKLRKQKNLTQSQLGEKVGASGKTVSKWETGLRIPDYSYLNDLCNVLEINILELLSGEKISDHSQNKLNENNYSNLKIKKNNKKIIYLIVIFIFLIFIVIIFLLKNTCNSCIGLLMLMEL